MAKKKTPAATEALVRDRIVDFRRVPSAELAANPKNWRTHPEEQRTALRAVLDDIGFADVAIGIERDGGVLLLDGHLRKDEVPDDYPIPTIILDLTDDEADVFLATLDPMVALARRDPQALLELTESIKNRNEGVHALLNELAREAEVHAHATGNAGFLDELVKPKGPHEDRAGRAVDADRFFTLSFTVRAEQRDIVMSALGKHRDDLGMDTTIEALVHLCSDILTTT